MDQAGQRAAARVRTHSDDEEKKTNEERISEASQETDDRMTLAAVLLVLFQRELHKCESKPHVKPASPYCGLIWARFFFLVLCCGSLQARTSLAGAATTN